MLNDSFFSGADYIFLPWGDFWLHDQKLEIVQQKKCNFHHCKMKLLYQKWNICPKKCDVRNGVYARVNTDSNSKVG